MLGSALGVLPIARISDRVDRRLVIAAVMIAGAACETALSRLAAPGVGLIVLGFLVGLTTYSLYTLAVSLANDHGAPHDLIFISVGLLFIYCVAAIVAPAIASVLMKDFGPQTLFVQNAYVHLAIAALALWRSFAPGRDEPRRNPPKGSNPTLGAPTGDVAIGADSGLILHLISAPRNPLISSPSIFGAKILRSPRKIRSKGCSLSALRASIDQSVAGDTAIRSATSATIMSGFAIA